MSRRRDHRVREDGSFCPDSAGCVRLYHGELGGPEVGDVCECCGQEVREHEPDGTHTVQWFGRTGSGEFVPRTKHMPASAWGWDARCSCGWETRTGGAIAARIKDAIFWHRWDIEHGFDAGPFGREPVV